MIQKNSFGYLPERIARLGELTTNMWWSWSPEARILFRRLNLKLWYKSKHNPIRMLQMLDKDYLESKANDSEFLQLYDGVMSKYDVMRRAVINDHGVINNPIVYFSFEFGLHQSIPIYSGGLGVLSGDTVKEAADMNLNYLGIGFLYHQGYFKQKIPSHGLQEAEFPRLKFDRIPIFPLMDENDKRMILKVDIKDEHVLVQVWYIKLANNLLYLMDTDIEDNKPWYRGLSARLYGGDYEMRINQEYLLASAGFKLLERLNITPSLWHLNEGHCAFISIKRLVKLVSGGRSYSEALDEVKRTTVFTTHTPVPAGHDKFGLDTVESKFYGVWDKLGISRQEFLSLGMEDETADHFNMTVLALNTTKFVNGVSKLHTKVTRVMWDAILNKNESTLVDITNGVHTATWISGPMRRLLGRYLGEDWLINLDEERIKNNISRINASEFWEAKTNAKRDLFAYIREDARKQRSRGTKDAEQVLASGALLDPEVLTIGFARRFATYKRANLIFRDLERFRNIINNIKRPVQIIFAGKAHPADDSGKQILQQIYEQALHRENRGRVVFIENYDTHIGRLMVSGVDVWMNTPIRPYEASGTSGMKAAMNGVPHLSISDGWWAEGFNGDNGWKIGNDVQLSSIERDELDANSLYEILENEIIPTYYDRSPSDVPEKWINICIEAMRTSIYTFSTRRMMTDYLNKMYLPALKR